MNTISVEVVKIEKGEVKFVSNDIEHDVVPHVEYVNKPIDKFGSPVINKAFLNMLLNTGALERVV